MSGEDWDADVESLRLEVIAEMERGFPHCEHCYGECDEDDKHQAPCPLPACAASVVVES